MFVSVMEVEGKWMCFETLVSVYIKCCILVAFTAQIDFEKHATYHPAHSKAGFFCKLYIAPRIQVCKNVWWQLCVNLHFVKAI